MLRERTLPYAYTALPFTWSTPLALQLSSLQRGTAVQSRLTTSIAMYVYSPENRSPLPPPLGAPTDCLLLGGGFICLGLATLVLPMAGKFNSSIWLYFMAFAYNSCLRQ